MTFRTLCGCILFGFSLGVSNFAGAQSQTAFERDCGKIAKAGGKDSARFQQLLKLHWDYTMQESPEFATDVGWPGQNHRWSDISLEAISRRQRELQALRNVIQSIKRTKLAPEDQLSYDLFQKNTEQAFEGTRFRSEYFQITPLNGAQQDVARYLQVAPHNSAKDYEALLARLNAVPTLIDQTIALLKQGLAAGITPPRITLRDVPAQVEAQLESDPKKNALLQNFREFPPAISEANRTRFRAAGETALKEKAIPAFRRLHEFLVKEYLPGARETIALSAVPDGKAWYAYNARVETTTTLTPKQIHELGLSEVKRIRAEMDKVIVESGFKGSFDEFLAFLRKDPRFYYTNAADLLTGYRDICKRIDPQLAKMFGRIPRLPYGVIAVPAYSEKSQTTAYYQPGSAAAGRPGYYCANTYALDTRPKWEMEALSLHESVPGHHFQIALAQELDNLPNFRKHGSYTAFVEGWGLYSESLGPEMGFYKDPYMKFGQLVYEMWRAIRLVVDTGMHDLGWTRQQAIDFFLANSSKTEHDVTVEVDRYIVWPGQALAYKIGELKIKELRAYATQQLGEQFDVRAFHDQILGNAAVPMDVLEARIKAWVAQQRR